MQITVKSEEIMNFAKQLHEYSTQLETEIKNIRNIVSNISTFWSGNDATKYINVMQEKYIVGLEKLYETIDEYAVYLNNIPGAYDLLDDVYTNKHIEI